MKKEFTQQDINQFFSKFKELPDAYQLEKVHQLINNPDAMARRRINTNFKPFKFMIMTSAFIIGITSIVFWLTPVQHDKMPELQVVHHDSVIIQQDITLPVNEKLLAKSNQKDLKAVVPFLQPIFSENAADTGNLAELQEENQAPLPLINDYEVGCPDDSVIDGEKFIITLSNSELEKIGFIWNKNGFFYQNQFNNKSVCSFCKVDSNLSIFMSLSNCERHFQNVNTSHNDFYPVVVSDLNYIPKNYTTQSFISLNDTLLPIRVNAKQIGGNIEDVIYWFKISEDLFRCLPDRYSWMASDFSKLINCKKQNGSIDIVKYQPINFNEGMNLIELSKKELQKIGFEMSDSIRYNIITKDDGFGLFLYKGIIDLESIKIPTAEPKINLTFVSTVFGKQRIAWKFDNEEESKGSFDYFRNKTLLLVPIVLRQKEYPLQLEEDQIFWFEPSEALFDALPESIGKQLRKEYYYITAETTEEKEDLSTTCTYFEECKSTLMLENCRLFPNPASTSATLEFTIPESDKGTVSLLNIGGAQLRTLVSTTSFSAGNNSFKIDLSGINEGIYLVMIKSSKGFKTMRLIVSR